VAKENNAEQSMEITVASLPFLVPAAGAIPEIAVVVWDMSGPLQGAWIFKKHRMGSVPPI